MQGEALLYINKKHSNKIKKCLKLYKPDKIEPIFVEVVIFIFVECIYRHPINNIDDFNAKYRQKLSKESSKNIFSLGDFNIVLLKCNSCNSACNFLDKFSSSYFIPQILLPSDITRSAKTLIDKIFSKIP